MRIHVAAAQLLHVVDTSNAQITAAKPTGLWWADRAAWLTWCATEMPAQVTPHIYCVDPGGEAQLAVLETAADLRAFTDAFAAEPVPGESWHVAPAIDWARVATRYDGIDVRELTAWGPVAARGPRWGVNPQWLHGAQRWDVPSGCLWRPNPGTRVDPVPLETVQAWFHEHDEPLPDCLQSAAPAQGASVSQRRKG